MPLQRVLILAGGSVLSLTRAIAVVTEVLALTDLQHPVNAGSSIRVIKLDAPTRLVESEVAAHVPVDPEKTIVIAWQRSQPDEWLSKRVCLFHIRASSRHGLSVSPRARPLSSIGNMWSMVNRTWTAPCGWSNGIAVHSHDSYLSAFAAHRRGVALAEHQ
jgi:hypothetical protein